MRHRKGWKKAEIMQIKELVNQRSNIELATMFDCTVSDISSAMQRYHIERSEEFIKQLTNPSGEDAHNYKGGLATDATRYTRIQRERYPERSKARAAVQKAMKHGSLIKPTNCDKCGKLYDGTDPLHFHHNNGYEPENWLVGVWVCRKCHRNEHQNLH
jgi:hypothetical protein